MAAGETGYLKKRPRAAAAVDPGGRSSEACSPHWCAAVRRKAALLLPGEGGNVAPQTSALVSAAAAHRRAADAAAAAAAAAALRRTAAMQPAVEAGSSGEDAEGSPSQQAFWAGCLFEFLVGVIGALPEEVRERGEEGRREWFRVAMAQLPFAVQKEDGSDLAPEEWGLIMGLCFGEVNSVRHFATLVVNVDGLRLKRKEVADMPWITLLMLACSMSGHMESADIVVAILLEAGANPLLTDSVNGQTAFHVACMSAQPACALALALVQPFGKDLVMAKDNDGMIGYFYASQTPGKPVMEAFGKLEAEYKQRDLPPPYTLPGYELWVEEKRLQALYPQSSNTADSLLSMIQGSETRSLILDGLDGLSLLCLGWTCKPLLAEMTESPRGESTVGYNHGTSRISSHLALSCSLACPPSAC